MCRLLFFHRHNVVPLTKYRAMIVDVGDIYHNLNFNLVDFIFSYNPDDVLVSGFSI